MAFFELALGFLQMSLYSTQHALSRQVKVLFSDHKSGMPLTKFLKAVEYREQNILRYFKFIATPTAGGQTSSSRPFLNQGLPIYLFSVHRI